VKSYCYTAVYHNAVLLCKMPPIIKYNLFCVIAAVYFADSLYLVLISLLSLNSGLHLETLLCSHIWLHVDMDV